MNPQKIKLDNGFIFTFTDDREWIYKAVPIPFQKKVVEKPSYKVIEELEESYLNEFERTLVNTVKDISKYLYGKQES